MATTLNADGTLTEFKIGQVIDDEINEVFPKVNTQSTKTKPAKLKKDGTPRKQMGPRKKFHNERKVLSGYIDLNDHNMLINEFGSGTNAIVQLIERFKQSKG